MLITWLPDVLRAAGIKVAVQDTWPSAGPGPFKVDRVKVLWHHDASPVGPSPGALGWVRSGIWANVWVDVLGTWHLITAGQSSHAGVTDGSATNQNSIGIETDHTIGEAWPPALLDSLRRGTAAILKHQGVGADWLFFHKDVARPVGRKPDPDGLNIATERAAVAAVMASKPVPHQPPAPAPKPPSGGGGKALPKAATPPPGKWNLPSGHFYGNIRGPAKSHGGYWAAERPMVRWIQIRLQELGFAPPGAGWADGLYEQPTINAVAAWQRAMHLSTTSRYGEVWSDDFANLIKDRR